MSQRRANAFKAAAEVKNLSEQLYDLGDKTKWHETRKNIIAVTVDNVLQKLEALGILGATKKEVVNEPMKPVVEKASPLQKSEVVYIPVTRFLYRSNRGAMYYETPGLVGADWYDKRGTLRGTRPNGKRAIPEKSILVAYSPTNGTVGVSVGWFYHSDQYDLQEYVENLQRDDQE